MNYVKSVYDGNLSIVWIVDRWKESQVVIHKAPRTKNLYFFSLSPLLSSNSSFVFFILLTILWMLNQLKLLILLLSSSLYLASSSLAKQFKKTKINTKQKKDTSVASNNHNYGKIFKKFILFYRCFITKCIKKRRNV